MTPASVEVRPGIWSITLPMPGSFTTAVNVYLIRDRDGFVLIDCGLEIAESRDALRHALEALGTTPDAIHTVVVTHGHHDHCGLAEYLNRQHGAQIWMHESDWTYIRRRYGEPEAFRDLQLQWLQRYGMPTSEAERATRSIGRGSESVTPTEPDRVLSGGETLAVGALRFEIQWTPGHTPGHVCLLEPTHQLLFSGDHVLPNVHSNVSLQPYSDVNPLPGYLASLRQLADQPIQLTMPGHGSLMMSIADRALQIAQHQLDRRERLLSMLTMEPRSPYDLAAEVWADSRPTNWQQFPHALRRNAVGTLIAHLEQLAQEGLARRLGDATVTFASRR